MDTSIAFYTALGLKLIVRALPHYARFECPEGDSTFSIHLEDKPISGAGVTVYFECADLDMRVENLVRSGMNIDEMPTDKTWLWREARLKDPDGNQLILFYAGGTRHNLPWRITEH